MSNQIIVSGVLRQWWNDATRTYTEYDAQGVQTLSRPYNAQENTAADAEAALVAAEAEAAALKAAVKLIITEVKTEKDALDLRFNPGGTIVSNTTVNSGPAPFVKDTYQSLKRTMAAVIDLAKLVDD